MVAQIKIWFSFYMAIYTLKNKLINPMIFINWSLKISFEYKIRRYLHDIKMSNVFLFLYSITFQHLDLLRLFSRLIDCSRLTVRTRQRVPSSFETIVYNHAILNSLSPIYHLDTCATSKLILVGYDGSIWQRFSLKQATP